MKRTIYIVVLFLWTASAVCADWVVDAFNYGPNEAAAVWQAGPKAPAPEPVHGFQGGLAFECPFHRGMDRVFWDRAVTLNLSAFKSFRLDLACDNPSAIQSLGIYFKSGDGWYAVNKPVTVFGHAALILHRRDFKPEGRPAGWDRIDGIRISPWSADLAPSTLRFYGFRAVNASVMVIRGTASAPNAEEREIAGKTADRISAWLSEMGIEHHMLTDEETRGAALAGVRTAILPYNPELPDAERKALEQYIQQGGQLIVFYSHDARLARAMGFKLGDYRRAEPFRPWSAMAFRKPGRWHLPEIIYQDSWNIRPAEPAGRKTEVLARWQDASGRDTGDTAWAAGPHGFWMSHILQGGDMYHKKILLAGLLAHCDPATWPDTARYAVESSGRVAGYMSYGDAVRELTAAAKRSLRYPSLRPMIARAETAYNEAVTAFENKNYPHAFSAARHARDALMEAYAGIQPGRAGELRGVWDHRGFGLYAGDWERTARLLASHGLNTIFPNMLSAGYAHYPSAVLPPSRLFETRGDQIAACMSAAEQSGLKVHVWKVCWKLHEAPPEYITKMKTAGRLQFDANGKIQPWLSPVLQENRRAEIDSLREIVQRYPVDGIHLDYIRFPDSRTDVGSRTRMAFEQHLGRRVLNWPADVIDDGALAPRFRRWRADIITTFVRDVSIELKTLRPDLWLSAAVFGGYPQCVDSVGQDWVSWIKKGYVDFVCPMNYTGDLAEFRNLAEAQVRHTGDGARLYSGIGVTSSASSLTADEVIDQIQAARMAGHGGFVLFDLDKELEHRVLPALSRGITAR